MSARIEVATWQSLIERQGFAEISRGLVKGDPFDILATRAAQGEAAGTPSARVTLTMGGSSDYGAKKVSITVSVPALCTEADISLAGEALFVKAHQMVNEASDALGLPHVD